MVGSGARLCEDGITAAPLLVIDSDLPKRLAGELSSRGRTAVSTHSIGRRHDKDPELLPGLVAEYGDVRWVLITSDDSMPFDHGALIGSLGLTVATVDPKRPENMHQDSWRRDVIHRWAHAIERQPISTIRRYSASTHRVWKHRPRPEKNPVLFR